MRHYITRSGGPLAGFLAIAAIGMGAAVPASAVPAQSPFPDTTHYERVVDVEQFKVTDEEGIWFGENEVGWFPGDPFPRLYHTDEPRFASGRRQSILAGQTYVEYRGSRCAVTMESGIYCVHGDDRNSQIMVTTGMTWRGSDAIPSS